MGTRVCVTLVQSTCLGCFCPLYVAGTLECIKDTVTQAEAVAAMLMLTHCLSLSLLLYAHTASWGPGVMTPEDARCSAALSRDLWCHFLLFYPLQSHKLTCMLGEAAASLNHVS